MCQVMLLCTCLILLLFDSQSLVPTMRTTSRVTVRSTIGTISGYLVKNLGKRDTRRVTISFKAKGNGLEEEEQEITDLNLEQMFEVFEAADNAVPAENKETKSTVRVKSTF